MKSGAFRAKRWISLGLLVVMVLSFAVPAFAYPEIWYKKIYVTKNPNKMTYEIGESFDPTGMKISGDVYDAKNTLKWTNDIGLSTLTYSPSSFSKAGKQKVTLGLYIVGKSGGYEWIYTSLTVNVNESGDSPSEYYTDIFVAAQPKKTIYTVGESFKTSGLSISGHVFNLIDGKKHTVTKLSQKNMKISPSKFTKAGKQDVKLSLNLLGKNGQYKWFSTTVQVLVEKGEVKITKHPTGETVTEGGSCSFIARADNDDSRHWFFSKNGVVVDAVDATAYFPGLSLTGTTKEKLKLSHIPASMNGWYAYCVFYGNDSSATSNKAGIVVFATEPAPVPVTEVPAEVTPKTITSTPQPTGALPVTQAPVTQAPATAVPITPVPVTAVPVTLAPATPAPVITPEPAYAQGVHCTINGQSQVLIEGDTLLRCEAETIDGFVFDHWEINGEDDYSFGPSASFLASEACVIRARYHERKVLTTLNCYLQLLTKNNNASGAKYTQFDFEDAYYNPVTKSNCPGGTLSCYITAVVPKKSDVDYWLINGVKYQFPDNRIVKFRLLDLNEATTIEPVFRGSVPSTTNARPAAAEELEHKVRPRFMRCINCWGRFMDANGNPMGEELMEYGFENDYTNPVTRRKLPGGKLDIFIATKVPRGCTVDTWIINDVWYQFPQLVTEFRVRELNEDTTYEVRFRGVSSATTPPAKWRIPDPVVIN